jgi:hypothetical protein
MRLASLGLILVKVDGLEPVLDMPGQIKLKPRFACCKPPIGLIGDILELA